MEGVGVGREWGGVGWIREEFEPRRQMRVPEKMRTDENGEKEVEIKNNNLGYNLVSANRSHCKSFSEWIYACIFILFHSRWTDEKIYNR